MSWRLNQRIRARIRGTIEDGNEICGSAKGPRGKGTGQQWKSALFGIDWGLLSSKVLKTKSKKQSKKFSPFDSTSITSLETEKGPSNGKTQAGGPVGIPNSLFDSPFSNYNQFIIFLSYLFSI